MKPRPDYQRRQAHRQRLALGRAMHQVRKVRSVVRARLRSAPGFGRYRTLPHVLSADWLPVPRIVRKHAKLLRHTFAVLGS